MGCWFLRRMRWPCRMRFCGCTVPQNYAESSVNKRRNQCGATPGSAQGCGWKLCFSTYWPERSDSKPVGSVHVVNPLIVTLKYQGKTWWWIRKIKRAVGPFHIEDV